MKDIIKKLIGRNKDNSVYKFSSRFYKKYAPYITVFTNMFYDLYFFCKHSNVFSINTIQKIEAKIILDYHSIEKGLLHKNLRLGFGKEKVVRLQKYLNDKKLQQCVNLSQIEVGYRVMCEYYELHQEHNFDISDYFQQQTYLNYKNYLGEKYNKEFKGYYDFTALDYFSPTMASFEQFSYSRKSVRNFSPEPVSDELIEKAVQLASNAPSVCNRQPSGVYYVKDKKKIEQILELQAGLEGYSKDINQLLVVTADVNYFYLVGERYQHYIDGGLFLMNLLYALHYYKIAACPANWAKERSDEKKIKMLIPIKKSEKVLCIVAIGNPTEAFRTTLSKRRDVSEILTKIE